MVYFFYGTLCDSDVQRLILGYRPNPRQLCRARLPGFRRKRARGHSYPVLVRAPGGRVDGLLFTSARASDASRLAAYEGPEYITRPLPVRRPGCGTGAQSAAHSAAPGRARVFLPASPAQNLVRGPAQSPPPVLAAAFDDWHLPRWQRHEKTAFLQSLHRQGPMPCANR